MAPRQSNRLLVLVAGAGLFLFCLALYWLRRWHFARTRVSQLERELAALRDENGVLNDLLDRQNDTLLQLRAALDGEPPLTDAAKASLAIPPLNFGLQIRLQPVILDGAAAFRAWGRQADRFVEVRLWDDGYACDLVTNDERRRVVQQYVGAHHPGQPDLTQIGADVRKLLALPLYNPAKEPNPDEEPTA